MGSCSVAPSGAAPTKTMAQVHNPVDGHDARVPHFGVAPEMGPWEALAERLTAARVHFLIEPHVRCKGQPGEQATLFFLDPSGNALEFKAFGSDAALFAT